MSSSVARFRCAFGAVSALLAAACSSHAPTTPKHDAGAVEAGRDARAEDARSDAGHAHDAGSTCTEALMDVTGKAGFYDSPFPSDARLSAAGTPDLTGFPNPQSSGLATAVLALAAASPAFGLTSSVYFRFTGGIATSGLDDPHTSLAPTASVFLVDVDPASPALGQRSAAKGVFLADAGPFGASNLLAVLPYQGVPLLPKTRYAAVVLRTLQDSHAHGVCASSSMTALAAGKAPEGMSASAATEYAAALQSLAKAGVAATDLAALSVFTTQDPTAQYQAVRTAMLARPLPQVSGAWMANEVFPTYCVFSNTVPMPEYQGGTPPYATSGGAWVFDASGAPVFQRDELANIVVTIPRAPMPASGYPIVNLSRTGVGGNRPLVDRGQAATNGGPAITPGSGPALYYAAAGFAGVSVDGPLGGLRNPTMPDTDANEDYTVFNVGNPAALRDNVRQSAVELSLTASIVTSLTFDASSCPGATTPGNGPVKLDAGTMALMSHSMGSTIAPLTLAFEPRYRAAILSGAGGSWIDNIVYKLMPLDVKPAVAFLLGIGPTSGYSLGEADPMVNMFQWAAEPADAPVYDHRTLTSEATRDVLKVQGIIDHYILPPICNTTSLSLGLDLAGPALDSMNPGLSMYTPLIQVLDLSGRKQITLPIGGNVMTPDGGAFTAVVTQHPSDGIEDGHEVIFQTDPPKHEYVCLLTALAAGKTPVIPVDGPAMSACP